MMVKIPFPQASNMIAENADIKNKTPQKKYVIKYVEKDASACVSNNHVSSKYNCSFLGDQ